LKRAGIIFVILVIAIASGYYYSLPSQDEFLRDNRWLSDRSALNLLMETECSVVFTYQTEDDRIKLPDGYKIGNHITSEPLEDRAALEETIQPFITALEKTKATQAQIDEWRQEVFDDYEYDELQYTAAVSTIELQLTVEHIRVINPNIPPIVVSTETVQKTVQTISVMRNNVWRAEMMIFLEEDGSYSVPPVALERYVGVETDVENI
jgi:hypothetical protein